MPEPRKTKTIWTVGHSNHEWEHFLAMLTEAGIGLVADVRRFPGSKRLPQFRREYMEQELAAAKIGYHHFPHLGGRRTERLLDSPNVAWRVEAFNAYSDYMLTEAFQAALAELESVAAKSPTAILCAEAVPWRCHRRLIADALIARGWRVIDIFAPGRTKVHVLTEFARVDDGQVTYPGLV